MRIEPGVEINERRGEWMIIEYTGRQFLITEKYKTQAEVGLERMAKLLSSAASAHIILTVDKYRKIAEITVKNGGPDMVAICESADMMTALRDSLAKIEQQAVRHHQKATTSIRHPRVPRVKGWEDGSVAGTIAAQP